MPARSNFASHGIVILALLCTPERAPGGSNEEGERWWGHVSVLAADSMEGRATGSKGLERASTYVVREFEKLGLEPGGEGEYRQSVRFVERANDPRASSIVIRGPSRDHALQVDVDAFFQMACGQADSLEAEAVFVGYGLVVPELGHDDLRGLDLRGRIAVYLAGGPSTLQEPLKSYAQSRAERWSRFRRAGAVGWLGIPNPRDLHWEQYVQYNSGPAFALADTGLDERNGQRFAATLNPARAAALFEGAGVEVESLFVLAESGRALPRVRLGARIVSRARFTEREVVSHNLVGVLRGSDPVLRDEAVVLSAHLDHLGIIPSEGDSILNGALDNAAGVATLIEAARRIREAEERPRRSIVFLAVTAEEHNLLGSHYFASRPTRPAGTVVANLNVDMFLPIAAFDRLTVYGLQESTLGDLARTVAERQGLTVQPDPKPNLNRFIRSDQFSFIRTGVPALAFHAGGSTAESLRTVWTRERYHAPADDLAQPVDPLAAARFNRFYSDLALAIARLERRPEWVPASFFRRFAGTR